MCAPDRDHEIADALNGLIEAKLTPPSDGDRCGFVVASGLDGRVHPLARIPSCTVSVERGDECERTIGEGGPTQCISAS